jgi:hypothetical protein
VQTWPSTPVGKVYVQQLTTLLSLSALVYI